MLELKFSHKISEIGEKAWDELRPDDFPFSRYAFLNALEESGSVSAKTGWQPLHLQLQDNGITIAVMPLYLKNHSYGEYVFDWAWADAYNRYGLDYYPKLVSAIPYSPVCGTRLLTKQDPKPLIEVIERMLPQLCEKLSANSWHLLFPTESEQDSFTASHILKRKGCQYQWFNKGYSSFTHYLEHFNSRKRKSVRKERQKVEAHGITHQHFEGEHISEEQIDIFYEFYRMTYLKRGREAYLNKAFFTQLIKDMPEHVLLILAYSDQQPVAGALSLKDSNTLYGRYWGCFDEYDSLHFETCYYQGIDYCIANNLQRFDSGAQGEHKIQRGFEPVETWSAHWVKEVGFNQAIRQFVEEESKEIDLQLQQLREYLPFKK